jgi:hypothetical protein
VDLAHSEFALVVVPTPASDGRTRLRFTPEVAHGHAAVLPTPTQDRSAWMFQKQQSVERYEPLSWEVTLAPNEHAIISGCFDRPETLGHLCFIRTEEIPPRQRLLIIKACRPSFASAEGAPPLGTSTPGQSPPLALQAALTTFRGVSP